MANASILVAEDEDTIRQVIEAMLKKEGYQVVTAANAEEALEILEKTRFDLLITDLHLPGASGIELLRQAHAVYPSTVVIVMTAFGTIQSAVEAMKAGAYHYVTKPIHRFELKTLVSRALERDKLIQEVDLLRSCANQAYGFENVIGASASLRRALDVAARVASADVTVLLHGETGTGKELIAKAIHFRSPRKDGPFVTVNCGAIPRELLESELFGHTRGSFTGAVSHKKGKAEVAEGGTLLLDEIGEMPLELQVRVLRLIQEHEIEKIGATNPAKLDVRIIAATHRDLGAMVKAGSFREDLYYRLIVVPIEVPPLRDRREDIAVLVQHFFMRSKVKYGRPELRLSPDVLSRLEDYDWPGNVRQLENCMERIVILAKGAELTMQDLPDFLQYSESGPELLADVLPKDGVSLAGVEKELILRTLRNCGGNQSRAAALLKISRRTLGYRLEKYGISTADFSPKSEKAAG
jgi:two-component system, NtrC family, response regulator